MTTFPAARELDPTGHDDSTSGTLSAPLIGPCGQPQVLIESQPAGHVYCADICSGSAKAGLVHPPVPGQTNPMINGASSVLVHGVPANRIVPSGDQAACSANILTGAKRVLIGGPSEDPKSSKSQARRMMKAGGAGTIADCDLVATELGKLPPHVVQRMIEKGVHVVACRGSVTDYWTHLKGVHPRYWPPDATWDIVPGAASGSECVIATTGHGTEDGPHIATNHGSSNMVIHESFHAFDNANGKPSANDPQFTEARTSDFATLDAYEQQAGSAGQEETYAESAARYYEGDAADATAHPNLHSYWASDPFK